MRAPVAALGAAWLCAALPLLTQTGAPQSAGNAGRAESLLAQAQLLVRDGKLAEALPVIHRFLEQRPDSPDGHAVLGFILFKQSKAAEAVGEYKEAAKYRKPGAFESKIVGLSHAMLNDYAHADISLSRSLEINPRDLQACNYLGEIKFLREEYADAVRVFRNCLNLDARNVFAGNGAGSAYEKLNRLSEAEAAYRSAVAWQSADRIQDPTPVLNLGRVLLKQNKPEEALIYLAQSVELGPEHAATHEQLGKAHAYTQELGTAQIELEKASRLDPDNARLHYMLGRLYRLAGMHHQAEREFEIFRALKKRSATAPD